MVAQAKPDTPRTATKPRRHWGKWLLLLLVVIAGLGYAAVERPWEEKPQSVVIEVVAEGPMSQVLAVNGRVVPREEVKVRSSVSGQALEVNAGEGDSVEAGAVLVQLDTAQPKALLDQARAALDAGVVKQQQAQANADRARALGENASRSAREDAELSLTAAMTEVSRLRAALEQAQTELSQYSITAPLNGVVLSRSLDRGQLVDPQSELFTIADTNQLLVETEVDELYSSRIETGLKVLLQPVGDTVPKPGTVVFASPRVDTATGGRVVKIAFDEAVELPVGLTINANIIVAEMEAALSVPRSAIVTEETRSHVLVVEDGVVTPRDIEFSDWPAERVVVINGLAAGEQVILDPSAVQAGDKVMVQ